MSRQSGITSHENTIIVVPDGLAADDAGQTTDRPSFVYRAALDWTAKQAKEQVIYLAPANRFGGPLFEQEAAQVYLHCKGVHAESVPTHDEKDYIDTRGNARILRNHLIEQVKWPCGPVTLVAGKFHARRAEMCFSRYGFNVVNVVSVPYEIPKHERIVSRLFYYRYPYIHRVYETIATFIDRWRAPKTINVGGK